MKKYSKYKGVIYLAGLLLVLPYILYSLNFKSTLHNYDTYQKLQDTISGFEAPADNKLTQSQIHADVISNGGLVADIQAQNPTVSINNFTPLSIPIEDDILQQIAKITAVGGYADLVKFVDSIEVNYPYCRILSSNFNLKRDRKKALDYLELTIIVQQLIL